VIDLRWYQIEAVTALLESVFASKNNHPVAVIPTGGGKSAIACEFINQYLSIHPTHKVLVLSHVKEILEQNHEALVDYFPGIDIGLYSAGLSSRSRGRISVAGIQSVYNKVKLYDDVNIVLIDECHLVTIKESGMYRKFLSKLDVNYVGLTATHYRLDHGYIHEGDGALFNQIAYDLSSPENFMRLVDEGYLSNLITKATIMRMNTENVKVVAGDFSQKDLASKYDTETANESAVKEIIQFGKKYKKWLLFCIDIAHAEHITQLLNDNGIPACCVHSQLDEDRGVYIADFKAGKYRAMVNVNILTTGFNVPDIDLIAMLRPTQSPVLHVQAVGRGLRVAPGKSHCLILDFAGNTMRLGPINNIQIKNKKKGNGEPISKECKECGTINPAAVKECLVCGAPFPIAERKEKTIERTAAEVDILRRESGPVAEWIPVDSIRYSIHQKKGSPSSLRVQYQSGLNSFSEWICIEHSGYAKAKAMAWVRHRWTGAGVPPSTLADLYGNTDQLRTPVEIFINLGEKYPAVQSVKFAAEV